MVAGVETPKESDRTGCSGAGGGVEVRMLGLLTIRRDGVALPLPASRKARALLAYLALAPRPVGRPHLCELLWDVPNDPRGELRWSLSKIRALIDEKGRRRVTTAGDQIALDLTGCFVDIAEIDRAAGAGIETLDADRLRALSALFAGDFLDGLELDRSPPFNGWLLAQRRRLRACQAAVLEHLVKRLPVGSDKSFGHLEKWLQSAPFDRHAHEILLAGLARRGRLREGDEHLAATARLFEAEGLDWTPLREAWRSARSRPADVAPVVEPARVLLPTQANEPTDSAAPHRASIAVMPFVDRMAGLAGAGNAGGGLADGLAHDVITRLAKLRSLFVIGQGTVFALNERGVGAEEAGRTLAVDYIAGGSVRRQANRVTVSIELTDARTNRIVWAEVFDKTLDDAFLVLDEIGNRIVASIASEIETVERNRAILKPPSSLDAWEAYHRGLWHLYRYNKADNDQARRFLEMAVRLDPTFARAGAALSFTHWQSAFQRWEEREKQIDRAFDTAGRSIIADDRDPAAHWAMGRALWLRGRNDQALVELETAVELSPSFAHGHYTLSFLNAQSGDAMAAIGASDHSRALSPFDPLLFAMLATRAMALMRLGRYDEAADWAVKAAMRPNAFVDIRGIAAHCQALAGRLDEARAMLATIRKTEPNYRVEDLLATFRFAPDAEALFRKGAKRLGIG